MFSSRCCVSTSSNQIYNPLVYCKQGLDSYGLEVMKLNVLMKGKSIERSMGINEACRDE